jgi:hypothetical protein
MGKSDEIDALALLKDLQRSVRRRAKGEAPDPRMGILRRWQSNRLSRTYTDLLQSERFAPACQFFLEEIYGDKDFAQRDNDVAQVYGILQKFIPAQLLYPLTLTIAVHTLTQQLDQQLLKMMTDELGLTDRVTLALYTEAYRRCDNFDDRVKQIEWIRDIGQRLDEIVRQPLTGPTVAVIRGPARNAGWSELVDFLDRGYAAFKHMRGAKQFIEVIRTRERRALDRIYANAPDPYGFDPDEP